MWFASATVLLWLQQVVQQSKKGEMRTTNTDSVEDLRGVKGVGRWGGCSSCEVQEAEQPTPEGVRGRRGRRGKLPPSLSSSVNTCSASNIAHGEQRNCSWLLVLSWTCVSVHIMFSSVCVRSLEKTDWGLFGQLADNTNQCSVLVLQPLVISLQCLHFL